MSFNCNNKIDDIHYHLGNIYIDNIHTNIFGENIQKVFSVQNFLTKFVL